MIEEGLSNVTTFETEYNEYKRTIDEAIEDDDVDFVSMMDMKSLTSIQMLNSMKYGNHQLDVSEEEENEVQYKVLRYLIEKEFDGDKDDPRFVYHATRVSSELQNIDVLIYFVERGYKLTESAHANASYYANIDAVSLLDLHACPLSQQSMILACGSGNSLIVSYNDYHTEYVVTKNSVKAAETNGHIEFAKQLSEKYATSIENSKYKKRNGKNILTSSDTVTHVDLSLNAENYELQNIELENAIIASDKRTIRKLVEQGVYLEPNGMRLAVLNKNIEMIEFLDDLGMRDEFEDPKQTDPFTLAWLLIKQNGEGEQQLNIDLLTTLKERAFPVSLKLVDWTDSSFHTPMMIYHPKIDVYVPEAEDDYFNYIDLERYVGVDDPFDMDIQDGGDIEKLEEDPLRIGDPQYYI